jgi:hypothetical protein
MVVKTSHFSVFGKDFLRLFRGRLCGIKVKFGGENLTFFGFRKRFFAHSPLISFRGFVYFPRPFGEFRIELNVRISNTSIPPICFDNLPTDNLIEEYHEP